MKRAEFIEVALNKTLTDEEKKALHTLITGIEAEPDSTSTYSFEKVLEKLLKR